jgi:hypothetical protein
MRNMMSTSTDDHHGTRTRSVPQLQPHFFAMQYQQPMPLLPQAAAHLSRDRDVMNTPALSLDDATL